MKRTKRERRVIVGKCRLCKQAIRKSELSQVDDFGYPVVVAMTFASKVELVHTIHPGVKEIYNEVVDNEMPKVHGINCDSDSLREFQRRSRTIEAMKNDQGVADLTVNQKGRTDGKGNARDSKKHR
jgi:hypothetical protein